MNRLQGRRVLVTGASRGLGAAIARLASAEGAFVYLGCRVRERSARQVLDSLAGEGEVLAFDQTDRAAVTAAIGSLPVDLLVNNAALTVQGWFANEGGEAFDEVVQTNLLGPANCSRAVVPGMLARGGGAIVHVGSVTTHRTLPGHGAYTTAKAGLMGLTRSMAVELAPRGIRVNAVVPGLLDTGMGARMPPKLRDQVLQHLPAGRLGTADEVAQAVLFLATASYVHGQCLVIDGGLSL